MRVGGPRVKAIIIWSGSVATIPDGWQLCDGTGGTPDLRDRFVMGALWESYAIEAHAPWPNRDWGHYHTATSPVLLGDELSEHTHTATGPASTGGAINIVRDTLAPEGYTDAAADHSHGLSEIPEPMPLLADGSAHHHNLTGTLFQPTTNVVDIRPPFYALCYIQGSCYVSDVPLGGIIIWYGDAGEWTIAPTGFAFCDGNNGTPRINYQYVMGAGNLYPTGEEGGWENVDQDEYEHRHPDTEFLANEEDAHTHVHTGGDYCSEYLSTTTPVGHSYWLTTRGYQEYHEHRIDETMDPSSAGTAHRHKVYLPAHGTQLNDSDKLLPPTRVMFFLQRLT